MKYKHSPIFKYIILLMSIFMFIKHLKVLTNNQNLLITLSIVFMVLTFDWVLIENHPNLLDYDSENYTDDNIVNNTDIEEIIKTYDTKEKGNAKEVDEELDDEDELEYPPNNSPSNFQLPTDYRKPSYDLNYDCYRRGDGRGNNCNVQRYYESDVM